MNIETLFGKVQPGRALDSFLGFLEDAAEIRPLPFSAGLIDDGSGDHHKLPGIVDGAGAGVAFTNDHDEAIMYANLVNQEFAQVA
jgi:hypothetical protein